MHLLLLFLLNVHAIECSAIKLQQVKIPENCGSETKLKAENNYRFDPDCYVEFTDKDNKSQKLHFRDPISDTLDHLDYTPSCSGLDISSKGAIAGLEFTRSCRLILTFGADNDCLCTSSQCRNFKTEAAKNQSAPSAIPSARQ